MIDDVKNIAYDKFTLNSLNNKAKKQPSFKGNEGAVDTTPAYDQYQPSLQPQQSFIDTPAGTAACIIPTWFALHQGSKLFNKLCGGEYDKSLVGRMGRFGDRIANSTAANSGFVNRLKGWGSTLKTNTQAFIDRHPVLSSMQKTPTMPENSFVKAFYETQSEYDLKDAQSKFMKFFEKEPHSLKGAGATKDEIRTLLAKYASTDAPKQYALQEFQITKYGGASAMASVEANEAKIMSLISDAQRELEPLLQKEAAGTLTSAEVKQANKLVNKIQRLQLNGSNCRIARLSRAKLSAMGLSKAEIARLRANPTGEAALLERALGNAKNFDSTLSQSLNKIKSISTPATKLGRLFAKLPKLGVRAITFGGGLFNSLFIAFFAANAIKNVVKAPKEQKVGTAAHGVVEMGSWVLAMPLALKAMHSVNGAKYLGLSKPQVEAFRTAQAAFNAQAKAGAFTTKAAYDSAKQGVMALKNVAPKAKGFGKIMKGISNFLSISLEQFTPFKASTAGLTGGAKAKTIFANIGRKMPNFLRNCVGYPLRFALYAFVFAPVVDKIFSGITTAIFGKAYDADKVKEEAEKEAQRRAELYPGPRALPNPEAAQNAGTTDLNQLSDDNLIKQTVIGVKPSNTTTQTAQPNGNPVAVNPQNGQKDPNVSEYDTVKVDYVPTINLNNPVPYHDPLTNPSNPRNYDAANKMMEKSDRLEKEANDLAYGK